MLDTNIRNTNNFRPIIDTGSYGHAGGSYADLFRDPVYERQRQNRKDERAERQQKAAARFRTKISAIALTALVIFGGARFAAHTLHATDGADSPEMHSAVATTGIVEVPEPAIDAILASQAVGPELRSDSTVLEEIDSAKTNALQAEAEDYISGYEANMDADDIPSLDFGEYAPNIEICKNYLEDTGEFTPAQICGILGNIAWESRFDPLNENGIKTSIGLVQDEGSRKNALLGRADWQTVKGQLDFMMDEFRSTEGKALDDLLSRNVLTGKSGTTHSFCDKFERPGKPKMAEREYYACKFYEQFFA
jgi:hypothetical protein